MALHARLQLRPLHQLGWALRRLRIHTEDEQDDYRSVAVHDRQTGTTERWGMDGWTVDPSISSDGRFVAVRAGNTGRAPWPYSNVAVRDRQTGSNEWVSVDASGNPADMDRDGSSSYPSISSNGRFVAFTSTSELLVPNDTCCYDAFVRDRQTGTTERVSVDSLGNQGSGRSSEPYVSSDGRFVAFVSSASNLVASDTNGTDDVFVRDRQTGTTQRASVDTSGDEGKKASGDYPWGSPTISADGRFVAFSSVTGDLVEDATNGRRDIFVRDLRMGTTERVNVDNSGGQGNARSFLPSISSGGRFVAFNSYARNLVANDTNRTSDVFIRDLRTRTTKRVSVGGPGNQGNGYSRGSSISSDARFVAFESDASNLVAHDANGTYDVFVHERDTTSPKVRRVVPTEGANSVALKADLTATFSERMDKTTIKKANFKLYKLTKNTDGTITAKQITDVTVTPSSDGLKVTLNPFGTSEGLLAKNTRYKAVVSTGALDVFGNRLDQQPKVSGAQPKVWYFKTRS